MPLSVAQLPEPLSTVPHEETQVKSEGQERIPALTNVSKVLLHCICQRHTRRAERHCLCAPRKPIEPGQSIPVSPQVVQG